jgi:hypothetical protein
MNRQGQDRDRVESQTSSIASTTKGWFTHAVSEAQLRLFPQARPLVERFGVEFFRKTPKRAGVYVMSGDSGRILYIGKAKNLRQRLSSYRYVRPAGKTWKLAWQVRAITWEVCDDGAAASLRENELLRLHKPVFNVANTRSEHYPFIALRQNEGNLELRITKSAQARAGEKLFGAFKGLPLVRDGFAALMRLCWAAERKVQSPYEFPSALMSERLDAWNVTEQWIRELDDFFTGQQDAFIETLIGRVPSGVSRFQQAWHERDAEVAREFFARGPRRNAELRSRFELNDAPIAQGELDDLLVLRGVNAVAECAAVG